MSFTLHGIFPIQKLLHNKTFEPTFEFGFGYAVERILKFSVILILVMLHVHRYTDTEISFRIYSFYSYIK
jgi:hypothetical protein